MNKEQLVDLLKDNLKIEINKHKDYDGKGFKVTILFENEKICSDYIITEYDAYYD